MTSADHELPPGRVVELFAGVGGFRIGLEGLEGDARYRDDWEVVWSNQWEPSSNVQHGSDIYTARFGDEGHVCADIHQVLDWSLDGADLTELDIPDGAVQPPKEFDLLVGGFPCQDYSVAKPLPQADGIEGKKGVLWWQINRMLEAYEPPYVLLENVDRLLNSPSSQRGRDFAVMLACFNRLGYSVEWRVTNAADYGFPQRRRRVFIYAERSEPFELDVELGRSLMTEAGVMAKRLPAVFDHGREDDLVGLEDDLYDLSNTFGRGAKTSVWENAGVMSGGLVWTGRVEADPPPGTRFRTLEDVLVDEREVPSRFFISDDRLGDEEDPEEGTWRWLKGAKEIEREKNGFTYTYSEGAVAFPEPLDRPSRTILTGEGGISPSRFKHAIETPSGRFRRLVPVELERLNGFPDDWTKGHTQNGREVTNGRRAFLMGNALVVGVVELLGEAIAERRAELAESERLRAVS